MTTTPTESSDETVPERMSGKVLLVDDEPNVLRALQRVLHQTGWKVATASSGNEALERLAESPVDVVVSDYRMPGLSGVELLREVKSRWPDTQRVMLTGHADQNAIQEAINRSEIFRFVAKPWEDNDLLATLSSAVEAAQLARENRRLLHLTLLKNQELAQLNASLEAKVAERTALLSRSKREWEATFDALDTPIAIVDQSYRVRRANVAWGRQAGDDLLSALSRPCYAHLGRETPCPTCPLQEVWGGEHPERGVVRELPWGDRRLVVSVFPWPDDAPGDAREGAIRAPSEGAPWAVVTYHDVTEERRTAEWRLHTERLAAVGRLAGGVAHEINNPLSGVLAFAQILLSTPRPPDDVEALKLIEDSALRCKRIIESLMRVAGSPGEGEGARQPVDIRRVTADTVTLFRSQLAARPGARIEVTPDPESLPTPLANPHAVGQALMDLLHHRLQALPASGGLLTLSTIAEGDRVGWRLLDTAPPLDPADVARLADPEVSDPAGLGLVFRVTNTHQGRLDVYPLPGQGNRFTLMLGDLREGMP